MPNSKDKKPRGMQRKKADFNFTRKEKRSDLEEHSPSEPERRGGAEVPKVARLQ
jgi:hypothetical protein